MIKTKTSQPRVQSEWLRSAGYGAVFCGLTMLIASCQSVPQQATSVKDSINDVFDEAQHQKPTAITSAPQNIQEALLPSLQFGQTTGTVVSSESRFDVTADNAPARQLFMSLIEATPYDMVVHPKVSGNITVHLKNVTMDEAMRAIYEVYGYEYKRDGNRYFVLGQGMQTRLFQVNYLNLNRSGVSTTRVASGDLSIGSSSDDGGSSSSTERSPNIEVQTASKADFWADLQTTLSTIIGDKDGRSVIVNPQANMIVIRALPTELNMVADFLEMTHTAINRQVLLDAKIVEVSLDNRFQSGINWGSVVSIDNLGEYTVGQIGGGTLFDGTGSSDISGLTGNLNPATGYSPITGTITSAFGGIFTLAIKGGDFAGFMELLKSQGDVNVLSSPRVSTVNNQKAVIKVGGDEFFVTGVTNTQSTSAAGTTVVPTVELTPFFSGIALDVTPQIDPDNNIILHIHPTISEVTQRNKNFVVGGEDFDLPLAFSSVQESDNIVRAKNGEIIIIGGLMKEGLTDQEARVPFLGDIPLLGNLFKHKQVVAIKRELVILLKTTVIENNKDWQPELARTEDRLTRGL